MLKINTDFTNRVHGQRPAFSFAAKLSARNCAAVKIHACEVSMTQKIRAAVEHACGAVKAWIGATDFLKKWFRNVLTEMSLQVLEYNLNRAMRIVGVRRVYAALVQTSQSSTSIRPNKAELLNLALIGSGGDRDRIFGT